MFPLDLPNFLARAPARCERPMPARPSVSAPAASWRYECRRSSRGALALAAIASALLHGSAFIDFRSEKKIAAPARDDVPVIAMVAMPRLEDLEDPDPVPIDDQAAPPDPGALAPMQQDLPQVVLPNDFVQRIDLASLIDRPDLADRNLLVVPENRGGQRLAQSLGMILNPADLDRAPEPIVQPPPLFPSSLRHEVDSATVTVEFIVDTQGAVRNAIVIDSTHHGFDDAAVVGIAKWKFRPGIKGAAKVNTRMRVPIVFRIVE
jgi:protein TonB